MNIYRKIDRITYENKKERAHKQRPETHFLNMIMY